MKLLRISELQKERGLTNAALAGMVNVTPATISNINKESSFPKPDLLLRIAEALEVDIRELFNSTKEASGEPLYIKKDGKYISVGEIDLSAGNES